MITNLYFKSKKSFVPFVPTDIAGCQLWLKADAGITKDGSNYVSQWDDQSGNNNHAVQATGSAQPLWVDNQLNGLPTVSFNPNDYIGLTNSISIGTVFIVVKYDSPGISIFTNYRSLLSNNSNDFLLYGVSGCSILGSHYTTGQSMYMNGTYSTDFADINAYKIICFQFDTATMSGLTLSNNNSVYCWDGNVSEKICYDRKINAIDRQLVENYLNTKYALW